ncbi:alpha/beta fold hydrolase [Nocardioides sp. GCM10027113]|uniref:alpha/beta fold hydrolase n=1 Tax=unclassified Nocardioides TaxID=2615069 RepID=UPI00361BB311
MERPAGIVDFSPSPELFPFESRWFESSAGPVHYIDEGEGPPLLLLHGNPDWGFLYRRIVAGLRDSFRCVVPDYPGFGLSSHPERYGYTSAEHARVVGELVDHLGLDGMLVMGQDWGGPIGMEVASQRPDRVVGLVMGNTWFWPADTRLFRSFSAVMSSRPLQWLITQRNFFVSPLMKRTLRVRLSEAEFGHYSAVVPTPESRRGIANFPRQIRDAGPWLAELEKRVQDRLADKPVLLVFGKQDPALGRESVIARWQQTFPGATLVRLEQAGHYIQEDAPDAIITAIRGAFTTG